MKSISQIRWLIFLVVPLLFALQVNSAFAEPIDEVEPNNTVDEAQLVLMTGVGNPLNASFSDGEDVDWYRFDVASNGTFVVELFNVAGATNTQGYSPGLAIFDENSTNIAEAVGHNSNGAGNTNQGIQFDAIANSTYYIRVRPYRNYGTAGPYNLRILSKSEMTADSWDSESEPNNFSGIAYPLEIGRTNAISTSIESRSSSYITNNHDRDWFRFETIKDQSYVVETFHVAKAIHSAGASMQLQVFDSDFTTVAEDVDYYGNGAGNTQASISFQATKGGTYFIRTFPYANSNTRSGPYSIRVLPQSDQPEASWDELHEPNNWATHAHNLTVGSAHSITTSIESRSGSYITDNHDRDWFRFEGKKDVAYAVETFHAAGAIHGNSYALQVEVFDSDFTQIATQTSATSNGGGTTNAGTNFTAANDGVYYARVQPYKNSKTGSGPYSIRVLPHFSQAEAQWDAAHEPNNWSLHAYQLQVGSKNAFATNFEARNSSYLDTHADFDWFRFDAVAGASYIVEIFNAAGAINSRGYPLQLLIYDSDGTEVGKDVGSSTSNSAGNVNASIGFVATKGGTYRILVYPYSSYAGSGPYSIRVLPRYDQPEANWNAAFEPNNWLTHAAPLDLLPCGRRTTIEARDSAYLTHNGDRDAFHFNVVEGQEYFLDIFDVSPRFGRYGLNLNLYDLERSLLHEERGTDIRYTLTASYTGIYFVSVSPYDRDTDGTYRIRVVPTDGEECPERPNPRIEVEGCASIGIDPETGAVTLRGTPSSTCAQTITRRVTCENGSTPDNVVLAIGDSTFPMTASGNNNFSVAINTSTDLPAGRGPFDMSISRSCPGQVGGQDSVVVGAFVLFDPSGVISDADTGQPLENVTVTLYRAAELAPDTEGQNGNCRTVNTNGGGWSSLPPALVDSSHVIDPQLDAINNIVQISPAINPQVTGQDGSYAWDVIEGCYYVAAEAQGYQSVVSALVGVPPEVTDLDLQLTQAEKNIYLPSLFK